MDLEQVKALDQACYMNTFGNRLDVCFEKGEGMQLYATDGTVYEDFLGGIAVNALGHSHPTFVKALQRQVSKLIHVSNLYYIENQARLAAKLVEKTCADRVFFANTGAEANEGAFKLAKIYFYKQGLDKYEIISLDKSFHGRTLAAVAATGQEKYQKPYRPLTPGFFQVEPNSIQAIEEAVTDHTAAIMIELIQGESGVHPMDAAYVRALRKLCDEKNILLLFDEVQTGMGRTGTLFAYERYGVEPDIFTSAKALGGGVPVGAIGAKQKVADAFEPGDHGTTFGGNPLAMAAGLAVFEILEQEGLVSNAQAMGAYFKKQLMALKQQYPEKIHDVRGVGLLIGIELEEGIAQEIFQKMFKKHYLTSLCKNTMRLAPPLIITKQDIDAFVSTLDAVLR